MNQADRCEEGGHVDYDRVARVLIRVALRAVVNDESKEKGDVNADPRVLSRVDRGAG